MKIFPKMVLTMLLGLQLGLSEGYLAIFQNGRPERLLPYSQEVFTDADREKLSRGIPFSTEAELNRLLEDFTS